MFRRLLTRWGADATRARVLYLETELAAERAKVRVLEAERDALAEVIARDRARVSAETALFHRQTLNPRSE